MITRTSTKAILDAHASTRIVYVDVPRRPGIRQLTYVCSCGVTLDAAVTKGEAHRAHLAEVIDQTLGQDEGGGLHRCAGCGLELDADDLNVRCDECPPDEGDDREALARLIWSPSGTSWADAPRRVLAAGFRRHPEGATVTEWAPAKWIREDGPDHLGYRSRESAERDTSDGLVMSRQRTSYDDVVTEWVEVTDV